MKIIVAINVEWVFVINSAQPPSADGNISYISIKWLPVYIQDDLPSA